MNLIKKVRIERERSTLAVYQRELSTLMADLKQTSGNVDNAKHQAKLENGIGEMYIRIAETRLLYSKAVEALREAEKNQKVEKVTDKM